MSWRKIFCCLGLGTLLTLTLEIQGQSAEKSIMIETNRETSPFTLPPLPFAFDALEPYIDTKTVTVHYSRHHKAYVDALNKAISGTEWQKKTLEELFSQASKLPASIRNNAGGHWNHSFYWSIMRSPANNPGPSPELKKALEKAFGSFDAFKAKFREAGITDFGSGWSWLVRTPDGSLKIYASHNQDNPLMDISEVKGTPLLACDVWEHAYYLKYLNRRDEYMDSFWNLVDWQRVENLLNQK